MRYRAEIDGLRAVAVVPVIFFHAGFSLFSGGFVGVDVFFVISGFLITSIIVAELDEGKFSIVKFYERRARRILPALFIVLATCLPFAWLWLLPRDMSSFAQGLMAVPAFASNILFWQTSGYFDTAAELNPLLHTWSLAVEEQYYVFFPIFLMLTWRLGRRGVMALLAVAFAASLAVAQWGSEAHPMAAFYLLPARGWELLVGAAVALYLSAPRAELPRAGRELGGALGLSLILYATFAFDEKLPFPSLYTLVPTVGAALIILFAAPDTWVGRWLGSRLPVAIGLISYSAYLWHQPLLAFARHRTIEQPDSLQLGTLALASLGLAYLSWKYVETPFRIKGRFSRKEVFGLGGVGSVFFVLVGAAGIATDGFEKVRTSDEQLAVLKTATASPLRTQCHTDGANFLKPQDACEYFTSHASWAVFGDSHAVELAYALAEDLKKSGASLKHLSFSGCEPTFGRKVNGESRYCSEWTEQAVNYIAENREIRTVVVTYRIHSALFGGHELSFPKLPVAGDAEEVSRRWTSYVEVLRHFVSKGKNVVLVLQAPELPKPIETLVLKTAHPAERVGGVSRAWWSQRSHYVMSRIDQIPKEVKIIDPTRLFCDEVTCTASRNGVAYYFDDDHLSVAGAHLVAREVLQAVVGQGRFAAPQETPQAALGAIAP